MYPPSHFQDHELEKLLHVVRSFPFATIITTHNNNPFITHIPLIFDANKNALVGHIDKNNPQVETLVNRAAISVIFHGPDSYISPSKMATKQLPTWNYIKVHCKGEIQVIDDPTAIMETMIAMTSFLEGKAQQYILAKDNKAMQGAVNYIYCFEIINLQWEGKFKLSQDKNETDQTLARDLLIKNSKEKINRYFEK